MEQSKILILIKSGLIALILLLFSYPSFAQNNEQVPANNNTTLDTADDQQDLFDDNTNYKEMYKDLNKDGEWLQMKESDLDADDDDSVNEDNNNNVTTVKIINVWRPYGMGPDWSPYSEGRWVYTYQGWIWSTDYDWGWAAYHYGRWVYYDLYGWVWMPGRYWAPSWVQWCYTPDYIGWYPLYPRWYGWHRHGHHGWHDRYYHHGRHHNWVVVHRNKFTEKINKRVAVDKSKNSEIINGAKTKAIVKFDGTSITNVGPKVTAVEKNTGQKINPKEINFNGTKGITKVDDNTVNIYRNDITKKDKEKIRNGTKTREINNGTKTNDGNSGKKTKEGINTKRNNDGNSGKRNKEVNPGSRNKNSNNGSRNNESTRNKESNSTKGSTPYKESTRNKENYNSRSNNSYKESNSNRGNNSYRESNSNRGNNNNRESNSSRGNNGSRSNNNSKSSNRK